MQFTLLNLFIWVLIFCCRIQAALTQAQHGTDVTLSCEVSDLPESSTVQWEREEAPVPNSTLFYNNTAYIILHNVDHRSRGKYYCILRHRGNKNIYRTQTLEVSEYTPPKKYILYRESSNSSNLALICKSKKSYERIMWIRQLNCTNEIMIAAEREKKLRVHGEIVPGKHSSTFYNGNDFIFHISPVKFSYSGTYRCLVNDKNTYSSLTLHTLRVFAEPTVIIRNQSVVLTCEVSDTTDRVILAWLRMEGNRAMLIKQEVLTQRDMKRRVSVTLNSVFEDQLLCQCAVFTENTLRALAPITLYLVQSLRKEPRSAIPKHTTALPTQGNSVEEGSDTQTVVTIVFTVSGCVVVLLGALLFYSQRTSSTDGTPVIEMKCRDYPHHSDSAQDAGMVKTEEEKEGEEPHYASITIVELDHGVSGNFKRNKMPCTSDSVIYSTINLK
ncbi:hypothetical protein PHYPO_G00202680 [Pangasianodon hypophthalmus]|uniref:Ig-like domain-containing protein n=1 Tax=Pangasianodon hypophthalmus TaxID=310915 RepID=A0A5N5PBE9_PANHP|nr:uncharacterized protein LOC113547039 isoform X2 [Pangasianodon hypophthalmus]KAB5576799.1 hypothetical protein PHYPO_G00202680 [Pangasianodon hypophthalmus]